jgi:hypothetical protein
VDIVPNQSSARARRCSLVNLVMNVVYPGAHAKGARSSKANNYIRSHTKDHAHEVNINAQRPFQTDTIIQLTDSYTLPKN